MFNDNPLPLPHHTKSPFHLLLLKKIGRNRREKEKGKRKGKKKKGQKQKLYSIKRNWMDQRCLMYKGANKGNAKKKEQKKIRLHYTTGSSLSGLNKNKQTNK